MKLSKIIKGIKSKEIVNFVDLDIDCLTHYSKDCIANSIFFCIDGENESGQNYIEEACKLGAKVVVTSDKIKTCKITQIIVKDVRKSMSMMAGNFYNNCHKKLQKIAVVGTNGKTTTSTIIASILQHSDKKIGIIGTNGVFINGEYLPNNFTTPDPIELHYIFSQMVAFGVEMVVMEVSAHAIYYDKIYGLKFRCGVFTNLSNEHLDFFKTMENYARVKMSFFDKNKVLEAVVNVDDNIGVEIAKNSNLPTVSYGIYNPANVFAVKIRIDINGSKFVANINDEIIEVETGLVGEYNVYNVLASIACVKLLGIKNDAIIEALKNIKQVDGRFLKYSRSLNRKIIIDFAHTPDGFEKVLSLIKKLRKGKIITLFGCVGYSDKVKRREMGMVAGRYSDEIILTSDNLGYEDFETMCHDIEVGVEHNKVIARLEDREEAVKLAYENMKANDTLVLLGKGNETKQVIKGENIQYSDVKVVDKLLSGEKF